MNPAKTFAAAMLQRLRDISSSNLFSARVMNTAFGYIGARAYPLSAEASESFDPIADVSELKALRERLELENIPIKYPNRIRSNHRMYGIKQALFGDAYTRPGIPAIEHGLFLGDFIIPEDTVQTAAPAAVTFGTFRKEAIQKRQNLPVFMVGPYSHYVTPHYSPEQLLEAKRAMGRTLIVYLSHSTHDSTIDRGSGDSRYKWLEKVATSYDTVLISTYWWDLVHPDVDLLSRMGFKIVSCGLMHDRNFLSRQRTLLELADSAVGDGIGTHIGYCLEANVPFQLIDMNTRLTLNSDAQSGEVNKVGHRGPARDQVAFLRQLFTENTQSIELQKEMVDHLWGFSSIRTREELSAIEEISLEIASRSRGNTSRYNHTALNLLSDYSGDDQKERLLAEALGVIR